jgi:hypothetical protein
MRGNKNFSNSLPLQRIFFRYRASIQNKFAFGFGKDTKRLSDIYKDID